MVTCYTSVVSKHRIFDHLRNEDEETGFCEGKLAVWHVKKEQGDVSSFSHPHALALFFYAGLRRDIRRDHMMHI